jgi:predicted phosphodiesterase
VTSLKLGLLADLHRTLDVNARGGWHNEYDFAGVGRRLERALAWFERQAVDVLLLCGDLTHDGHSNAMRVVLDECTATSAYPVMAVSGNHDVARGEDALAREIERVADPRLHLADARGQVLSGIRIAGLQVAPRVGFLRSRLCELPPVDSWGHAPVILVSHLPLLSRAAAIAARGMAYPGDLLDRQRAAALLHSRLGPTIVVAGHIHARDVYAQDRVLQLTQAAMVEAPFDAAVIEVRREGERGVMVTRRTHRTGDQRAAYEPTLVGLIGSWRYVDGSWAEVDLSAQRHDRHQLQAIGARP